MGLLRRNLRTQSGVITEWAVDLEGVEERSECDFKEMYEIQRIKKFLKNIEKRNTYVAFIYLFLVLGLNLGPHK